MARDGGRGRPGLVTGGHLGEDPQERLGAREADRHPASAGEVDLAAVLPGDALDVVGEGGEVLGVEDALLQLGAPLVGEAVGVLHHDELTVAGHDVGVELGEPLARGRHRLDQQGAGVDPVLAGDVAAHGQAPGGLAPDDGPGLGHLGTDPLEADGHLVTDLPVGGRDPVQQVGGGHVAHGRPRPALAGQQVVVEQDQDLVGGEVGAGVVDDSQAVRVPVGGDAQVRSGLDDGVAQCGDGPLGG